MPPVTVPGDRNIRRLHPAEEASVQVFSRLQLSSITTSSGLLKILGTGVLSLASPLLTTMSISPRSYSPPAYFGNSPWPGA